MARVLAPKAVFPPPPASRGIAVAGELNAATGLGEAARSLLAGARDLGFGGDSVALSVGRAPQGRVSEDAALLLAVNAPSLPLMLARAVPGLLRRRVIGSWAWELPVVPESWAAGGRYVHEVWAPSAFVAQALEPVLPGRVRVVPYPLALHALPVGDEDPGLDLPSQIVVTLMVLSLGSSAARKNPLAGVAAFKRAFADRTDQRLIIKLQGAAAYPHEAARIEAMAGPNIQVISGVWPKARMATLMECADIVLSLHRAEGFGLVLAEAMLRGKPVVATGWSGNLAFMDESSAALIGYRLVKVEDESGIYASMPDACWAEPDIGHAAEWLRKLGDDCALRQKLGGKARNHAAAVLNGDAMGRALAANGVEPLA
ncbi:MAG: glycosyltransferase [Rhodospirillales bacterium]|nr:glycosyltransferase [Rhodospirillales bacterium]